jgi:hypothetical protein
MFSKCSVDCIHNGKNNARHRASKTSLEFCRYLVVKKALEEDLKESMSVARKKSWTKSNTTEAISCSRRSVNASKVNDDIHNSSMLLTYDNLRLCVSQRDNQVMIESPYGNCGRARYVYSTLLTLRHKQPKCCHNQYNRLVNHD